MALPDDTTTPNNAKHLLEGVRMHVDVAATVQPPKLPGIACDPVAESQAPSVAIDHWLRLISERGAAGYLGVDRRTLQRLRQHGGGPLYVRLSARCIRYRRCDLDAWVESRLCAKTLDEQL